MNNSFDDRRKHLRFYRHFIMSYHEKGKATVSHHVSQVNNISRGGLSFSLTHPLKQGIVLTLDLKVPFTVGPFRLEGSVLECREKIPGMVYEVRIQFQSTPEQVLTVLKKIEDYSKTEES